MFVIEYILFERIYMIKPLKLGLLLLSTQIQAIDKKSLNTDVNAAQSSQNAIEKTVRLMKFIDELDCSNDSLIGIDKTLDTILETRDIKLLKALNELRLNKTIKLDIKTLQPVLIYQIITPEEPKPELVYPIITPNSPKPEVVLLTCNKN